MFFRTAFCNEKRWLLRTALFGTALALMASGCSGKSTDDSAFGANGSQGGTGEFADGRGISGSELGDEPQRVDELGTVYFDYDRAEIRGDARPTLKSNSQAIQGRAEWSTITIEGHCDERGSEEYNLALGERRATAAKRYLVDLGVPSARLMTVSFGESSPAVQGHEESAWRWNRRVEFRVSR